MHIAVDARYLDVATSSEEATYLQALLEQLFTTRPEHTFFVIDNSNLTFTNTNVVYSQAPSIKTFWKLRKWNSNLLPKLLQQHHIEMLLCINSLPANTTLPQIVFISSVQALRKKPAGPFAFLYKRYWPKQLQKATAIATISQALQQIITSVPGISANKIKLTGYATPLTYQPANWQQRETILEKFTSGKEYFLFTGPFSENQLLLVLKAFSIFKKWQKSSLQLLVAGVFSVEKSLEEKLATYKHRQDVTLFQQADAATMATLTAGAYAVIDTSENNPVSFSVATALAHTIPVIGLENNNALDEIMGEAALYVTASSDQLANQMKLIYKDENLRQQLVAQLQNKAAIINSSIAAQKLWECMQSAAAENRPTFTAG